MGPFRFAQSRSQAAVGWNDLLARGLSPVPAQPSPLTTLYQRLIGDIAPIGLNLNLFEQRDRQAQRDGLRRRLQIRKSHSLRRGPVHILR